MVCSVLPLLAISSLSAAELTVDYDLIARTGSTQVPGANGAFTSFGGPPSIDTDGNVAFVGVGGGQVGVYTAVGGCCQVVADKSTPLPNGNGINFETFTNSINLDIDGGRVAFLASGSGQSQGLYSNVGQANASNLVEVALIDGVEWNASGEPWVDGDMVGMYGQRLTPDSHYTQLLWNGSNDSLDFADPGAGFDISFLSQASLSGSAAIFSRSGGGVYDLGIRSNGGYEVLAEADVTAMPGVPSQVFTLFYSHPVVGRGGLDAAFYAKGSGGHRALFKRSNGGALQKIADNTTAIPGAPGLVFSSISDRGYALADGQLVFFGGYAFHEGIYTDIGGELWAIVDSGDNSLIELDGSLEEVVEIDLGKKSFVRTPEGYQVVFTANLASGDSAIIRATVTDGVVEPTVDEFTVYKDFSDGNSASVSVSLSCTSGTVTNNPQLASEASPAVFTIEDAAANATCTAVENTVPEGYTADESRCQNGDPLNGTCTIINTLVQQTTDQFWVYKDFSDNNTASVSVSLSCTSGTVTNNPQLASESSPAVFLIADAAANATCTAQENTVPAGYTADESGCQNGDPLNGACTIVNTLDQQSTDYFWVYKDFSDNNTASVSVTLTCDSGTVTNNPQQISESRAGRFVIAGASPDAKCTASEHPVPAGYTKDERRCQNGDPLNGVCTIVNTRNEVPVDSFTVYKDFSDGNSSSVSVNLTCTSGTVINNPQFASEASPAVFSIEDASASATCTAVENSVPAGYSKDESDCQNGDPLNGACTIVNTALPGSDSFTVYKDFSDGNASSVSISLNCTSGTVTNNPQPASESSPAVFSISGASASATCTAVENTVPSGYTKDESDCQNGDPLNGACTIVNTAIPGIDTFTVYKDFSDDNQDSVSISLVCSSGIVTNSPQFSAEGMPAEFDIQDAAPGTTCTAVESPVPNGYTKNETDCQDNDPINSSCVIVNNRDAASEETIRSSNFETGSLQGWSGGSDVSIDGILAIDQYSLRVSKGGFSELPVSTVGYNAVSVTMNMAGTSFKRSDVCEAEVSTNGGANWTTVLSITSSNDNGVFRSNTAFPAGADNNPDLVLRFSYPGNGKGGYCYGDNIVVTGTPN